MTQSQEARRDTVRADYAAIAAGGNTLSATGDCCSATAGCCAPAQVPDALARDIGYSSDELQDLPEGANLGLSCGNPTAIAGLQAGEVVVDLGSGGGFDCFLAGPKVGAHGRVIGIDMTAEMLAKARHNLISYQKRSGLNNVEFRLGEIEHLPLPDQSVDVVLSNCVINLSTDKAQVWREIARVLKPGGRVSASDMALLQALPPAVTEDRANWTGCVGGAIELGAYEAMMVAAGLQVTTLAPRPEYVATLIAADDPFYRRIADQLGDDPAKYITSLSITAQRPAACCGGGCC